MLCLSPASERINRRTGFALNNNISFIPTQSKFTFIYHPSPLYLTHVPTHLPTQNGLLNLHTRTPRRLLLPPPLPPKHTPQPQPRPRLPSLPLPIHLRSPLLPNAQAMVRARPQRVAAVRPDPVRRRGRGLGADHAVAAGDAAADRVGVGQRRRELTTPSSRARSRSPPWRASSPAPSTGPPPRTRSRASRTAPSTSSSTTRGGARSGASLGGSAIVVAFICFGGLRGC